jgi:uncharacterized protein YprB with RNaseH-like and TPR domain
MIEFSRMSPSGTQNSLADKLKALGVKIGASQLPAPAPRPSFDSLGQILHGRALATPQGETYLVEQYLPTGQPYGLGQLHLTAPLQGLAKWASNERLAGLLPQSFAFLDTETTGLSGGTGTLAFLIGVARFEQDHFHLAQFFLRDPAEEPAQLAALEEFLAPCQAIVSFNGKSFDIPLLLARYTLHGWQHPFADLAHVDLLHLARRLWRDRLPSRTLANLEVQILNASRTEEDVPGWMIPQMYADYLRTGDADELRKVFYHNSIDVISLAALLNHMAGLLDDPLQAGSAYGVDLIALAKLFEDLGDLEMAERLYLHGLEHDDARAWRIPRAVLLDALHRLAAIHKHQGNYAAATHLWEQAAQHYSLEAFVELAKYYEHTQKNIPSAIHWTQTALRLVETPALTLDSGPLLTAYARRQWQSDLIHRLERLNKKLTA